jgi:hypothetical protein
MTLNLISAHIHDVLFSYAEIKGDDYEIRGYFCLEKGKPLSIPKDSYCFLKCKKCFYDLYPNKYDFIKLRIKKSENSDNLEELEDSEEIISDNLDYCQNNLNSNSLNDNNNE